jgi:hypothetical protein
MTSFLDVAAAAKFLCRSKRWIRGNIFWLPISGSLNFFEKTNSSSQWRDSGNLSSHRPRCVIRWVGIRPRSRGAGNSEARGRMIDLTKNDTGAPTAPQAPPVDEDPRLEEVLDTLPPIGRSPPAATCLCRSGTMLVDVKELLPRNRRSWSKTRNPGTGMISAPAARGRASSSSISPSIAQRECPGWAKR